MTVLRRVGTQQLFKFNLFPLVGITRISLTLHLRTSGTLPFVLYILIMQALQWLFSTDMEHLKFTAADFGKPLSLFVQDVISGVL